MKDDVAPPHSSVGMEDWFSPRRFALILALMICASFPLVLGGEASFVNRDFGLYSFPAAYFHRQSFWRGEIPLWNPYNCCGLPFLAQFNTLVLYPLSLIYLVLPLPWSLSFFCLFHVFLGGLGMYFLASRWAESRAGGALAGVAFAFNGLSLNFLMWPSHIATFCWMPWVILLVDDACREGGRKIILAALAAAMEVLAGGPETILFSWLILALAILLQLRKSTVPPFARIRRFLVIGVLALCLSAALLFPFADLAMHSQRNTGYGGSGWSMPIAGWANLLVPLFQTGAFSNLFLKKNQFWTSSYYPGIGIFFLAFIAACSQRTWRVRLTAILLLLSLIFALGDDAYLYLWLRKLLPFLGLFRYPVKFVILSLWAFPLLAAFAISRYEKAPTDSPRSRWLEIICAAGMISLIGLLLWLAWHFPPPETVFSTILKNGISRAGFLLAFLAVLSWFIARPACRKWSTWALAIICWIDVMTHMPTQNPTVDPTVYHPGLAQMKLNLNPLPTPGDSRAMMSCYSASNFRYQKHTDPKTTYLVYRIVFLDNCNLLDDVSKVDGFFVLNLRETDRVLSLFTVPTEPQLSHVEDLLGVSQTIAPGKLFDWIPRSTYMPMVTAGQAPVFADDETIFNSLTQTNADFRKTIYLPLAAREAVTAQYQPTAHIISSSFGLNRGTVTVETPAPTIVLISQAYYHNWIATVDGKSVPLWRANYMLQAVEVPAGRHELKLIYHDKPFLVGAALSIVALLACLVSWFILPTRRY